MKNEKNMKAYLAEAFGTFVLVFFACGVAAVTSGDIVPTALAFGFVIFAMAYTIGGISGCHINPAVSLGCLITKRMSLTDFIGYVIGQIVGGILGAVAIFAILKIGGVHIDYSTAASNFAIDGALKAGPIFASILLETVLTAVFVFVILNVTEAKNSANKYAGIIIGVTLILVHLLGIKLTGTSVNPARSIGTAFGNLFFSGEADALSHVWIFIIGPMAGGALAAVLYNAFAAKKEKAKKEPKVEEKEQEEAK